MISLKTIKVLAFGSLVTALSMFVIVVSSINVQAETSSGTNTSSGEKSVESKKNIEELRLEKQKKLEQEAAKRQAEQESRQQKKVELKEKLVGKRLEACQKKEKTVSSNMQKIVVARSAQLEAFDKILTRTQEFYEAKDFSVANYDELVADANAKRALAASALQKLKAANVDFQCESESPLQMAEVFRGAREEMYRSMKEYRAAIKVLIVEIRSSASKKEETS